MFNFSILFIYLFTHLVIWQMYTDTYSPGRFPLEDGDAGLNKQTREKGVCLEVAYRKIRWDKQ